MSMREYLQSKGLFETVIQKPYNWTASGDYMKFPLFRLDGTLFITPLTQSSFRLSLWNKSRLALARANGQREPMRFLFEPKTPDGAIAAEYHPALYTPPGLWDAVKARGGRLGITSGESDMMTMIANDTLNVTTLFGENNIPAELPTWVFEQGALSVNYYPDLDRPGTIAAINMWHTFNAHGMKPGQSFSIFALPSVVNEQKIKDINDIWQAVKFDKAAFSDALKLFTRVHPSALLLSLMPAADAAPAIKNDFQNALKNWRNKGALDMMRRDAAFEAALTAIAAAGYEIAPPPPQLPDNADSPDGATPAGLWDAIEFALGGMGLGEIKYQSNGWSKNIRCPFRQHEHDGSAPAFALHKDTGSWKCPKCGATGGWKQLAQQIGVRIEDFTRPNGGGDLTPQYPNGTTKTLPNGNPPPPPAKYTILKGDQLAETSITRAKEYAADPRDIRGVPIFGGSEFDHVLKGLHKHDIMVIIARTGAGKSTLALQLSLEAAKHGPVGIISPENDPDSLYDRALSHLYGVNWQQVYSGRYPDMPNLESMYRAIGTGRQIEVIDEAMPTIEGITTYVNDSLASNNPIIALCIDSIQNILSLKAKDIYSRYDNVMAGLQSISRRIPVIATSQANRGPADRRNKWPIPSDCFGGSSIEFTLKRGLSMWRPFYDYETGELDDAQMDKIKANLIESGIVDQVTPDTTIIRVVKDRFFPNLGVMRAFDFLRAGAYGLKQLPTPAERLEAARSVSRVIAAQPDDVVF